MRSPSLLPTFEALEARTLMAGTPDIGLLQAETGAMVASALNVSFETQEEAFSLQQRLNLEVVGGKYYENERGKGEKWLQSRTDRFWYCIFPNGEVRKDDGSLSLVTTLSPAYHTDPLLLLNAKEPVEEVSSFAARRGGRTTEDREEEPATAVAALSPTAFQEETSEPEISFETLERAYLIQDQLQLEAVNGQYYANQRGENEKWLQSRKDRYWYYLLPNGELRKDDGRFTLVETFTPAYHTDPLLLLNAREPSSFAKATEDREEEAPQVAATLESTEEAISLQERLQLEVVNGQYYQNERGKGEKWLRSKVDKFWYCLLPNGEVRKDDGNLSLVTTLSPAYHKDPLLLLNAKRAEVSVASSNRTYRDLSLSEPSARRGFAAEALNITGLSLHNKYSARDLASRISPELFGLTSAQDEAKLEELALREAGGVWNRNATLAMSRIRGSRNALFSWAAELSQDAAPTLENAILVAFEEALLRRLGRQVSSILGQSLRPMNPNVASIRVIPTADELRAKVEANFDALYDLLLHFSGEEEQIRERTERLSREGNLISNPTAAGDTGASTDRNAERALRLAENAVTNSLDPRAVAVSNLQGTQTQVAGNLSALFSQIPISDPNGVITGRDFVANLEDNSSIFQWNDEALTEASTNFDWGESPEISIDPTFMQRLDASVTDTFGTLGGNLYHIGESIFRLLTDPAVMLYKDGNTLYQQLEHGVDSREANMAALDANEHAFDHLPEDIWTAAFNSLLFAPGARVEGNTIMKELQVGTRAEINNLINAGTNVARIQGEMGGEINGFMYIAEQEGIYGHAGEHVGDISYEALAQMFNKFGRGDAVSKFPNWAKMAEVVQTALKEDKPAIEAWVQTARKVGSIKDFPYTGSEEIIGVGLKKGEEIVQPLKMGLIRLIKTSVNEYHLIHAYPVFKL